MRWETVKSTFYPTSSLVSSTLHILCYLFLLWWPTTPSTSWEHHICTKILLSISGNNLRAQENKDKGRWKFLDNTDILTITRTWRSMSQTYTLSNRPGYKKTEQEQTQLIRESYVAYKKKRKFKSQAGTPAQGLITLFTFYQHEHFGQNVYAVFLDPFSLSSTKNSCKCSLVPSEKLTLKLLDRL